jgi:DNA-binding NarL/FixJ family response regulator
MNLGKNIPTEVSAQTALNGRSRDINKSALLLWVVDDRNDIRDLLANLIARPGTIECTRTFSSAEALLDALKTETPPDAILMDVEMGGMSGIDAIQPVRSLAPSTHIFVMTTFYDGDRAARAFNLGASGFVLKRHEPDRIADSILRISAEPVPTSPLQAPILQAPRKWRWSSFIQNEPATADKREYVRSGSFGTSRPLLARLAGVLRTFY